MLNGINIHHILFLDIETAPAAADYGKLEPDFKALWERKARWLVKENETAEDIYERAGIYAEFGKVICISAGFFNPQAEGREFRIKSFYGHDEKQLLTEFAVMLQSHYNDPDYMLCAHNGKEFDFPYLARRMLINGIRIPDILNTSGKKPWEVNHLDTMQLWRFGDYKHYTSLQLLTAIFKIPTPKDQMQGSDVARVYWKEKDMEKIRRYCQKDTIAVVQLFLKYRGEEILKQEEITEVLPENL